MTQEPAIKTDSMNNRASAKSTNSIRTNMLWHRRLGLSVFVVLIFLAISGFALNHSPALKLNKIALSSDWLLSWYGFEQASPTGFEVNGHWLYRSGNRLFIDSSSSTEDSPAITCDLALRSAAANSAWLFALCSDAMILLTPDGQFVEQFTLVDGLPSDLKALSVIDEKVYLLSDSAALEFDPQSLAIIPTGLAMQTMIDRQAPERALPEELAEQLEQSLSGPSISLETVILDLHSGRFFGDFGVLFIDLIGLLVCVLSITGLLAWLNRR